MFSDNEKISLSQLKRLLVFDLFSISGLIIPHIAAIASGKDGIISIILATLYAIIYSYIILNFAKLSGGRFLDYSTANLGKVLTFIIGFLYILKLLISCMFAMRLFGEIINETLLEDTDPRIIILLILIVSAYSASKGFEVRARITEVLYFIVIVPIFIFLILGLSKVQITNLMPLFTKSPGEIISGGYGVFLTYSVIELLLFTSPLIQVKNSDIKKGKKVYHYVIKALVITGILNVLIFIVTMGILGNTQTGQKLWSMVTIFQIIKLPGGFVQRQDAFILTFWMLSIFTIVSAFFYYTTLIGKKIFKVPNRNYLIVPFLLVIFGISVLPIETEEFFSYFEKYMKYIGIPQSLVLPLIVVLFGKLRKKSKKAVINASLIIFITLSTLSLTGCSEMAEIEDRNFIQAIGIDSSEANKITSFYVLPDLKALTEQGSDDPKKLTQQFEDKDYWEIQESYSLENNKRLDFSHLKVIILGKNTAQNKDALTEFLTYVQNKYEIARNTLVFLSDSTADDIISLSGDLEGGVGDYLEKLYRINLTNTGIDEITVGDLILAMNEGDLAINIPILKAEDKKLTVNGFGIFSNNKVIYAANHEEGNFIDIANGYGKNKIFYLTDPKDKEKTQYVVKINKISRTINFQWIEEKPYVNLLIESFGLVEKGFRDSKEESTTVNANKINEMESRTEELIKNGIVDITNKLYREYELDFINLYRLTSYYKRDMWFKYKGSEKDFIKDLNFEVKVTVKIQ
ncbi:MAG: Spore germination protein [Anaerocolumna sp.]|jgi:spore germination protein (amino acid permease)/Ger(x)C family germination protein|nr:Spore germination protein [Anaerocolumna sp.]